MNDTNDVTVDFARLADLEPMADLLTELRGPRAIEHLSKARAVVSLRMQEMIDGSEIVAPLQMTKR